jgi:HD-GYP domain-containing protein (c-di-GMP phosphodiesterase class II)
VDLPQQQRILIIIDLGPAQTFKEAGHFKAAARDIEAATRRSFMSQNLLAIAQAISLLAEADYQASQISTQLAQAYEQLVLFHKIATHMALTEKDRDFLSIICDNLLEVLAAEGICVVLRGNDSSLSAVAQAGRVELDSNDLQRLYEMLQGQLKAGKEAVVEGHEAFAGRVRSIMAVPLLGKEGRTDPARSVLGMIVVVNPLQKDQFDSTDMKLLTSVGAVCGVFITNGRLYTDLRDLLLGLLIALAQGIDAKDQYTLGHSERVAFISRWIAQQLYRKGLINQDLVHVAYFAGLLHDIGKIGVDDWILRKSSSLTESEWASIRRHPVVGAGILRQIRQMGQVLPAVLSHHERVDGKGYPHGLKGDKIPLIARIVGLADSFDAMTSRRSYRPAKDLQQAIDDIQANLDIQFDGQVAAVFLESDLARLWELLSTGPDRLCYGDAEKYYQAAAVEALVR